MDFDGTIVENRYPEIGTPIPGAISTLLKLQKDGHRIILWTCRKGNRLHDTVSFCRAKGKYAGTNATRTGEEIAADKLFAI